MADSIKIGNLDISSFKVGSSDCKIYLGDTLLYPKEAQPQYFTITSLGANNVITLSNNTRLSSASTFSYSTDNGTTWSSFSLTSGQTQTIATLASGDTLMMYGTNTTLGSNYNAGHYFRGTADYTVSGEISSLVNGSDLTDTELSGASRYALAQLFSGDTHLVSAENLLISSTELPKDCFNGAFRDCINLVAAPTTLPSTVLGDSCYSSMFEGCINLSKVPSEISFTSARGMDVFQRMFCMNRNSKVTAAMTESPKLFGDWGTISVRNQQMFCGNGSLETIYCYWVNNSNSFANLYNWVNYTDDTNVTFYKRSTQSFASGVNGIKSGWTVVNDDTTIPTCQWVLYQEGDTVPASFVYGIKLYLGLEADNEIDFQNTYQGGGVFFMYSADADGWYGIDADTSKEIDLSSYYDSSEGCYIVLFSDLGYGGFPITYPSNQFEFDVDLYM